MTSPDLKICFPDPGRGERVFVMAAVMEAKKAIR